MRVSGRQTDRVAILRTLMQLRSGITMSVLMSGA